MIAITVLPELASIPYQKVLVSQHRLRNHDILHLLSRSSIIFLSLPVDKVVSQIGFAFVSQQVIEELLIVIDETINLVDRLENFV